MSPGPIIGIAAALGLVHLTLGWLLGRVWPLRRPPPSPSTRNGATELRNAAKRLAEQVAHVNHDVNQHQGRMQQVSEDLLVNRSGQDSRSAESVLRSVAEILYSNAQLQSRLAAAEERLEQQGEEIRLWMTEARTDPLTGLMNRRAFDDAIGRQVAEWRREGLPFSVLVVDADHFKSMNDRHGHAVGDFILRQLAEALEGTLRRMDSIARIGGEEFAVILPNATRPSVCRVAEQCRQAVASRPFRHEDLDLRMTISLGAATIDARDDADSILRRADQALYAAKQAGRNCTYFHGGNIPEPVVPSSADENPPSQTAEAVPDGVNRDAQGNLDLAATCAELRERLAKVTRADD